MIGRLVYHWGGKPVHLELPKSDANLGQAQSGEWQVSKDPLAVTTFWVRWDDRGATWKLGSYATEVSVNGLPLDSDGVRISTADTIRVSDWMFRFETEMATPLFGDGTMPSSLPLVVGNDLSFGRDVGVAESGKIRLDADDRIISKSHLRIFHTAEGWMAEDLSKTGSELNGRLFGKSRLVFGDRIRISRYLFEFGGDHIRRIDHLKAGSLRAEGVVVEVPDRNHKGKSLRILDGVDLEVRTGEFIGILGGSGQGKSTLLNALCGINPATKGTVTIEDVPVHSLIRDRPGSIGYVPQDDIVHPELTVRQAFRFSARLRLRLPENERKELIDRTIEVLGLTPHVSKKVSQLSGGQRKRVSIGIELLSKPDVLFLDEPSSGLDPATEKSLMELLQALSLTNLTVICTTHVLQNAFLFNRLFFVHGGKLIFSGSAPQAREFFLGSNPSQSLSRGMPQSPLERIYPTVLESAKPASEWENQFHSSKFHTPISPPTGSVVDKNHTKLKGVSAFTKLNVLVQRQLAILRADWLNLAFLLSQAVLIGLLVAWVSDDLGFRMFLGIIAAMWFGCSNGAQQIVAEIPIFRRERICGLGVNTYLSSKVLFQGALTCAQALLLFVVIIGAGKFLQETEFDRVSFLERLQERENPLIIDESGTGDVADFIPIDDEGGEEMDLPPEEEESSTAEADEEEEEVKTVAFESALLWIVPTFDLRDNVLDSGDRPVTMSDFSPAFDENGRQQVRPGIPVWTVVGVALGFKIGAFLLVAVIGVGIGLAISSLVRTSTQAVMWVPLVLIPQILFGGFVISISEMSEPVRKVARGFPSYSGQRLIDVSHLYGRRAPKLTNQTKTPTFLTSEGDKENVEWEVGGKTLSQDFEKASEVNTSWQNLAVRHDRIGQHEHVFDKGYNGASPAKRETVEQRNDVNYKQGTLYQYLQPGWVAASTLGIWFLICFAIMQLGLRAKRS